MTEIESKDWGISFDEHSVEAWSTRRPPFEPRGWQREFRDRLRAALRQLRAVDGWVLTAEYETPDLDFADVENVLLYNVGSGAYGHLVGRGLSLRRTPSRDDKHRLSYRVGPASNPEPKLGALLATVHTPLGVGPAAPHSAGTWWRLLRPAVAVPADAAAHPGEFTLAIELEFETPVGARGVSGSLKPLLDGLVSALHVQRPAPAHPDESVSSRLALLGDPQELWNLLTDDSVAVLGAQSLVRAGKTNLVWNPADDRCSAISVSVRRGAHSQLAAIVRAAP